MGDPLGFQIEGASKLARTLKKAGADMKDLRAENKKAAQVVVNPAKSGAPKVSGKLAKSIRAGATQKAGVIRAGSKSIPYAPIHEFGWTTRGIPAKHYVTGAAHSTEPVWTAIYEDAITRLINGIEGDTA
jgi:phage gpG-like protein